MNASDYEVPGEGAAWLADVVIREIASDGLDCASVDLLLQMSKGDTSEVEEFNEVISIMTNQGHADRTGQVIKMALGEGTTPDYKVAANALGMLSQQGLFLIYPHLLSYSNQGPDCFDLAMVLGWMQYQGKAGKAAQLLKDIYLDESPQGQPYKSLVPCCLGSLCDSQFADSAADLVLHFIRSGPVSDYQLAGWCLAQHVFFGRPDWAAGILDVIRQMQQRPIGYQESALIESISTLGGPDYFAQISACLVCPPRW